MLTDLYIQNYILIDKLKLSFLDDFTVITGETGAGKSVIIGALALLLGDRFDQKSLLNSNEKCIIEGTFQITSENILPFFQENDIDFQQQTIIRREIAVGGRSRAFVNDTPVSSNLLKDIGMLLVDIHSQHATLELQNSGFQLNVVDRFGKLEQNVEKLKEHFFEIQQLKKDFTEKQNSYNKIVREQEYRNFVLNELNQAAIKQHETNDLEQELQLLSQADNLLQWTEKIDYLFESGDLSLISSVEQLVSESRKFKIDDERVVSLRERLNLIAIELKDIAHESSNFTNHLESNPERLEQVIQRLDALNKLIFKYHVTGSDGLIALQKQYQNELKDSEDLQQEIAHLQKQITEKEGKWNIEAKKISEKRLALSPKIEQQITQILQTLGTPEAQFLVVLKETVASETGIDQISFLFSANCGITPNEIKKVASGGELSRIMLAIKYLISESLPIATFIFDEIDTGISGVVATKVSDMLKKMAEKKQIIAITHLPSIAATGKQHLYIYKLTATKNTLISARYLQTEERIKEVAQIIGGEKIETSTLETAKHLLHIK